jgi:hypothetical protein
VVFVVCFAASFQVALANNIVPDGERDGLRPDVDDLNFPGTPLPDYAFPWSMNFSFSTLSPLDPGFWEFGLKDGTFLVTGNTYYNFTGDQQISIIEFHSNMRTGFSSPNSTVSPTPEPRSAWLFVGVFGIIFGISVVRFKWMGGQPEQSLHRD